eukprot:1139846-Pelagomonas_calceolata.AAC.4
MLSLCIICSGMLSEGMAAPRQQAKHIFHFDTRLRHRVPAQGRLGPAIAAIYLVTTACKLSFLAAVEPDAYSPWGEVTGPDLDDNLVVDHRRIKVPGGFVDVHLGPRVDAVLLAQCHELQDGFAQAALQVIGTGKQAQEKWEMLLQACRQTSEQA